MTTLGARLEIKTCSCCKEPLDIWNTQKDKSIVCENCAKKNRTCPVCGDPLRWESEIVNGLCGDCVGVEL